MADSDPLSFDTPPHWEVTTLGAVCNRSNGLLQTGPFGSQLHAHDYVDVGIPSIMPVNIGDGRVIEREIKRIKETDAIRLSRHRVRPGDIVFSRRGDVERHALVTNYERGWLCGTGCMLVRLGNNVVIPQFASYWLRHPDIRAWLVGHAVGSTMPNLNTAIMAAIPFAVPPNNEQRAIARILGTLDDKIELNRRMNQTLEALARALFQSWFVDFDPVTAKAAGRKPFGMNVETARLFPDRFVDSPLGPIPKGWGARPLPDLFNVNPTRPLSQGTLAAYLDMSNMPTQGPSPNSWVTRRTASGMKFQNGDTLVARITPCLENGKTAFVDFLADSEVGWGSTEYIVLRPKGVIPPFFAYLLARSEDFRAFAIQQMTGSSGRQRVPANSLDKYRILSPELDSPVFQFLGQLLTPIFDRIKVGMVQSRTLAALRDALLPRLLSGELRVKDADSLVEEAQ